MSSSEAKEKDGNIFLLWITPVVLDSVGFSWLLPKFISISSKIQIRHQWFSTFPHFLRAFLLAGMANAIDWLHEGVTMTTGPADQPACGH